jgi:hypothetical protein
MTGKVFVHVGPPKTGSTYLQQVIDLNAAVFAERGICVPDRGARSHVMAALDVLGKWSAEQAGARGRWKGLVDELAAWSGPAAVVTCELLADANTRTVDRVVSSLEPAEVHVVYMARDLSRLVPGMWQTLMRNTIDVPWGTYLASVRGDARAPRRFGRRFWRQMDPRFALARWERRVPREHIHVVTVPPSGGEASLLWSRFCEVIGMDPEECSLDVRRSNESLGSAEADLLRRINAKVAGRIPRTEYDRWVKRFVARRVLENRDGVRRIALPEQEHSWVRPRAEEICEFLETHGYDLVGDTRDLLPAPVPDSARAPDDVDVEEVLDAAVDVIAGLVRKATRERRDGPGPRAPRAPVVGGALRVSPVARARAVLGRRTVLPARWRRRR